jgi:hypothetical protein
MIFSSLTCLPRNTRLRGPTPLARGLGVALVVPSGECGLMRKPPAKHAIVSGPFALSERAGIDVGVNWVIKAHSDVAGSTSEYIKDGTEQDSGPNGRSTAGTHPLLKNAGGSCGRGASCSGAPARRPVILRRQR